MLSVVAYTNSSWDHAQTVLRLGGPYKAAGIHLIQGTQSDKIFTERVSEADLVLIQRDFPIHQQAYERILSLARTQSKPIVFDLDDLLLGLPVNHPDRQSHYYASSLFPMLRCILEADGVTAVSTTLADIIRPINPNVWVLHNYLNDDIWDLTPVEEVNDDVITIGYMGGDSHAPDFDLIIPVLDELLQSYQNRLALKLVGMSPFSKLQDLPNVEWFPFQFNYTDYTKFARKLNFDVMIAPMWDIPFNRSKGSMKFQEASALSIPGVYSDTLPFQEQVNHGENGYLVTTPDEWRYALVKLIEDKSLRRQMGLAALQTLLENWLLSKNAFRWNDVYEQILSRVGEHNLIRSVPAELFVELIQQTQPWQQNIQDELNQAVHQRDQLQATLLDKEQYITSLTDQLASYKNSLPGKLLRTARRAASLLHPGNILHRHRSG
jgi:glycosyltransferase involved in cell wall biosynthesis